MKLSILIYDGVTALDAIGGYEILARLPGMEVEFFSQSREVIAADTRSLGLLSYRNFEEVTATDILYIPGGPGGYPLEKEDSWLQKIRELDATSTWTIGICNGVGLLGAAGLLKGKEVTTNWFYQDYLKSYGATFKNARYWQDGKYITGAGVSASIDTGLFMADLLAGEKVAKTLQLGIEYYPDPPFPEKAPADAPDYAKTSIAAFEKVGGAEQLKLKPNFNPLKDLEPT
ncbi:DJ-1/PfpI family protein [Sneathiella limimaris]|uniref:DJ-1/PfpI family protein n=1 Tax=Sneathiella limimaris TaxID=1964213 RepID=UPI00146BC857|nr:DJ-1/PfpI family protein [Sneathiella limimaris]